MDQDQRAVAFVKALAVVVGELDGPERLGSSAFLGLLEQTLAEAPDALPMVEILREQVAKASSIGRLSDQVDEVYREDAG